LTLKKYGSLKRNEYIIDSSPSEVSFVVTGECNGDEDLALAEYLRDRLLHKNPCISSFLNRVKTSPHGRVFTDPAVAEFPLQDLELALQVDHFPFAMEVKKKNKRLVAQKACYLKNSFLRRLVSDPENGTPAS
jgi:hypothetical protein